MFKTIRNKANIIKYLLWFLSVLGIGLIVYLGFGTESAKVKSCNAEVSRYVLAEFSDTDTGFDEDGVMYTETDSWTEPASLVATAITINGELHSSTVRDVTRSGSVFYPPMPKTFNSISSEMYFDRFSKHTDTTLRIEIERFNGSDYVTESIGDNELCIGRIGQDTIIKTWFGISYSVEYRSN